MGGGEQNSPPLATIRSPSSLTLEVSKSDGSLAQLVEQRLYTAWVGGSSPSGSTISHLSDFKQESRIAVGGPGFFVCGTAHRSASEMLSRFDHVYASCRREFKVVFRHSS